MVLILDNASKLDEQLPNTMRKLQEKAKLWADTNTVKLVFVTSEDHTEFVMQSSHSNWSRAATPLNIGDLSENEAVDFLTSPGVLDCDKNTEPMMDVEAAKHIHRIVGGRMLHLVTFKHECKDGTPLAHTLKRLKEKETEKLLQVAGHPSMWKV